jgi:hypothetical protein
VIIGKLIPAGTGLDYYQKLREEAIRLYEEEEATAALGGAGNGELSGIPAIQPMLDEEPTPTA